MAVEDAIRATVLRYLSTFSDADREGWLDLFEESATVEDPVGSPLKRGRDEIGEFWDQSHGLADSISLELVQGPAISGNEAAFAMEAHARSGGTTMVVPTIDVMTFDAAGKIKSQRAFWEMSAL
jgi:steroid Delta-isomerase